MGRKKQEEILDPLARVERHKEWQNWCDNLFIPFLDVHRKDAPWLIEGMLPEGYLVLLASPPKSGKTCLATAMALAIATGTPFAGRETKQGAVLWLSAEENPEERHAILKSSPIADTCTPFYTCYQKLESTRGRASMPSSIGSAKPRPSW